MTTVIAYKIIDKAVINAIKKFCKDVQTSKNLESSLNKLNNYAKPISQLSNKYNIKIKINPMVIAEVDKYCPNLTTHIIAFIKNIESNT